MKPRLLSCLLALPLTAWTQGTTEAPVIAEAGPHHRVLQWTTTELDEAGNEVIMPRQVTELADGLNWRDASGAYQPTRSEFTRVPGGFAVTTGPHKVFLPDALEAAGAQLTTPDGLLIRSAPLCLGYFDPVSGASVILAVAQTAFAEQVAPNEIVYAAVLASPAASVHYVYERGAFHQNLVLHEAPPPPEAYSLSPASRLELLSEFSGDSPLPVTLARVIGGETDPLVRAQMVEPDLVDETLAFGAEFTLREGRAFRLGEVPENEPEVPVAKRFTVIDQRPVLIEGVEHSRLKPWLDVLPQAQVAAQANTGDSGTRTVSLGRRLPVAYASRGTARPFLAATRPQPGTGVVLDWAGVVSGSSDVTLKSDLTYKVVGATTLNGTTTLEGAVVKYVTGASIECFGPVVCKTDSARPCILTAADDDTVGEALLGSTHDPTQNYYANPALKIRQGGTQLHDLRVSHAQLGLFFYDFSAGNGNTVTHAQFVRCATALQFNGYGTTFQNFRVGNVLMNNVGTAFYGYSFNGTNEHLTLNGVTTLASDYNGGYYGTSSLAFTNSLLVAVSSDYSGTPVTINCASNFNRRLTSPTGVFQQVAAGAHYLANDTYRQVGSPNLTPSLAAELKQLTTHPPTELTGTLANPTTLSPDIPRDTETPDLGYHYPALDRIFNNVTVTGTLTLTNGVAVGLRGTQGLQVGPSAQVTSEGRPVQMMNRIVSCANVGEQWLATGGNTFMKLTTSGSARMDFRFTDFSVRQGARGTILDPNGNSSFQSLSFRDCWLRAGYLWLYPQTASSVTAAFMNNLIERCDLTFGHYYYSQNTPFDVDLYNNLFAGGALAIYYGSGASNPMWEVHDNLFDNATITAGYSWDTFVNRSHNGFVNYGTAPTVLRDTVAPLTDVPSSGSIASFTYAPAVGDRRWYQASTDMFDQGSRNANLAGLYHYTTRADQTKELTSPVDIGFHYVREDPREGLVARWRLDELNGTTAADGTGRGHSGTVHGGATWAPGRMANALNFDGTDDDVSVPDAADLRLGTAMTIAFWLKKNGEPSSYARLVGKGALEARNYGVWTCPAGTGANYKKILFQLQIGASYPNIFSSVTLEVNQWYHVACTYDGTWAKIYINGSPSGSAQVSGTPQTSTDPVTLGFAEGQGSRMNGTLDDVRIYNCALNAGVVALLASSAWDAWGSADLDGDGLADYFEDRDGDNVQDTGETKLNDPDTDYDGRSDAQELAEATNPLLATSAAPVRLGYWPFNDANWTGERGQWPKTAPVNVKRGMSFRTSALQVKSADPANLKYRDVEANGAANINCRQGTLRFWFKPAWTNGFRGGTTPGRLLEMGSGSGTTGWWALEVNEAGSQVAFKTRADGSGTVNTLLARDLSPGAWPSNQWRQIALTYSPTASALYVDGGQLGTNGPGVSTYPNVTTRAAYGFSIGSNQAGGEQAKGQFEELETFNYALSTNDISANYVAVTNSAVPFAMGVYGDLQKLAGSSYGGSQAKYNSAIAALTNWIGGGTNFNLKVALCSGDIVDGEVQDQYLLASNAWSMLRSNCLVAIAPGNHDDTSSPYEYDFFRDNFSWITNVPGVFGGSFPDTNHIQNAYWRTNISGLPFLFVTLAPQMPSWTWDPNVVAWASNTVALYPDDLVVIVTHDHLWPGNEANGWTMGRSTLGWQLWGQLICPLPNVWMVLCGHMGNPGTTRMFPRATNSHGRSVNELFLDFSACYAGEPFGTGTNVNCACEPDCIGRWHDWWYDGRSAAVARLIKVDPLMNSVTVDHWSCEGTNGGFWLDDFTIPGTEVNTEGSYEFPLFD